MNPKCLSLQPKTEIHIIRTMIPYSIPFTYKRHEISNRETLISKIDGFNSKIIEVSLKLKGGYFLQTQMGNRKDQRAYKRISRGAEQRSRGEPKRRRGRRRRDHNKRSSPISSRSRKPPTSTTHTSPTHSNKLSTT